MFVDHCMRHTAASTGKEDLLHQCHVTRGIIQQEKSRASSNKEDIFGHTLNQKIHSSVMELFCNFLGGCNFHFGMNLWIMMTASLCSTDQTI